MKAPTKDELRRWLKEAQLKVHAENNLVVRLTEELRQSQALVSRLTARNLDLQDDLKASDRALTKTIQAQQPQ